MLSELLKRLLSSELTLHETLQLREQLYIELTKEAFRFFGQNLTDAVNMYAGTNSIIEWESLETLPNLIGFVRVIGFSTPSIGTSLDYNGTKVTIDETNVDKYKQITRFTFPFNLLNSGSSREIYEYIKDFKQIAATASQTDIENILREYYSRSDRNLTLSDFYNKMLDKETRPSKVMDFDVSELTDEQIAAIYSFMGCKTETVN